MPYRVKEAIHTNTNPLERPFKGKIVSIEQASFVMAGKGAVLSDEDAEALGLIGTDYIEPYDPDESAASREAANLATHKPVGESGLDIEKVEPAMAASSESSPEPTAVKTPDPSKAEALARPYEPKKPDERKEFLVDDAVMPELIAHFKTLKQPGGVHPNRIVNTLKKHGWGENVTPTNKEAAKQALTDYAASK
jgi:hypothetical protein